jgi:hypothetical protein
LTAAFFRSSSTGWCTPTCLKLTSGVTIISGRQSSAAVGFGRSLIALSSPYRSRPRWNGVSSV